MGEKLPKTMLTDQDAAMSKALASQWPHTYHRLCIWHIFQNAATHLSSVFAKYKEFSKDFSNCIYDYEYEEEFLDSWSKMFEKYELQNNDWLQRLFTIRKKWALVYGRETFCADMTTTQRSESMNNVIKHYVSTKDDLTRFFENFQRLVDDRRYREMVADFKTSQSRVMSSFPAAILKQASSIYTPALYLLVQEELGKVYDCHLEVCGEIGSATEYKVIPPMKHFSFLVTFDSIETMVCCTCRKFEFAGLLCMHVLKVFSFRGIMEIPEKYILKRWTKNAKRGIRATIESSNGEIDPTKMMGKHYRELCRLSNRLVIRATKHIDGCMLVKEGLLNLLKELDLSSTKRAMESSLQNTNTGQEKDSNNNMTLNENGMMKEIRGIKQKQKSGGTNKRRLSALETAKNRNRKSKTKTKRPAKPSNVDQENQTNQVYGISSQQSAEIYCSPVVYGYNYSTSEYEQDGMHNNPQYSQPSQQFSTSYMALLTSVAVPQASDDELLIGPSNNNS